VVFAHSNAANLTSCVIFRFDDSQSSCPSQPLIAELRADIARERVIIESLDAGYPSAVAESMLHALEGALRIFEKHRGLILDELERQPSE
jgi:hypothetical protein